MTAKNYDKIVSGDLSAIVKYQYSCYDKIEVGSEDNYVLGLSVADDVLAGYLTNFSVKIMKISNNSLTNDSVFKAHQDTITGLKFSPENKNILFTSSKDGKILSWDLRVNNNPKKPIQVFEDNTKEKLKPVNCLDIDPNGTFLCGGTDQIEQDAYLLFWDVRSTKLLGGYWESHPDDITDVCYHPTVKDRMISGGTDGLINIFDLSQQTEDDALINTLNSESSVGKLRWTDDNNLACITHTEELQIWNSVDLDLVSSYTRENLKDKFGVNLDYFIDVLQIPRTNEITLVTGSARGSAQLWSLTDEPSLWTDLKGSHVDVVRCVAVIGDKLMTGGEDGRLCLWDLEMVDTRKKTLVVKQKLRKHQEKPY